MEVILGTQKNILVLGAGYGGLRAAMRIEEKLRPHPGYHVSLIDQNQHHQLITHLHEVAGGRTPAGAVALPLERLLGLRRIDFQQAGVTGLDLQSRKVFTDRGEMQYEHLVIALGSETNFYGIPGMQEHAFSLKSLRDACLIQGHIHEMLATAAGLRDRSARREALAFIVGGGGFTGVELASELVESLHNIAPRYGISPDEPRVAIVEAGNTLLPGLDPGLVKKATRILENKGIDLVTGTPAKAADARGIMLASGQRIDGRTVIWAGGVRAPEALKRWGLPTGAAGRVKVNEFLEVEGHPEIYVVGDSALVIDPRSQRPAAPSAQLAVAQAEAAASNILAGFTGESREAYQPHMAGEAISLGRTNGVAWIGPIRLGGRPAQWLKAFIARRYLWETGGLELVRSYSGLGKGSLGRDFPECLLEFRPEAVSSERPAQQQAA